ncbi:FHA domain-containing protein [Cedecea sp. P7760]|jgi:type III secretion protein D|uniref:FHA domain-containing protein n=1 Tax=Cedecea sp. P7760 TaxID=2726983 RepID=UPI0015A39109|nr:FHA domain-containing protein [Cedecea sp. P7760]NWC65592.1 type III secretion protein HrpQ [Cedecea sp. P7760]
MYELRVLNGLHEGAALPLSGERWQLGNSADSDLQLNDGGIKASHALLSRSAEGWMLTPMDGTVCHRHGERLSEQQLWQPGEIFAVGGVWLTLAAADEEWDNRPPPPPVPVASQSETASAAREPIGGTPSKPAPAVRRSLLAKILPRWAQIFTLSSLMLLTFTIFSWVLQPGIAQQNSDEEPQIKPAIADSNELRSLVEQDLRERELYNKVQLTSTPQGITLTGELQENQLPIVSRMVDSIRSDYQLKIALNNQTKVREAVLPFHIVQITAGPHANIVTADGQRLFVGDERNGLRLTGITADSVQFGGKENIAVKW